jgi:hypothetical protein
MDFPADIAASNRRRRIRVLCCKRSPDRDVPMPVTLPLDKARIEEMEGPFFGLPRRSFFVSGMPAALILFLVRLQP